jgi:hypothetical protein
VARYVDLDRTFRNLEQGKTPELSALHSYTFGDFFRRPGVRWEDLLKKRLVVVLGEPGSGKTVEFRERARRLNADGQLGFFVRLEQLVADSLEDAVEVGDLPELRRWKASKSGRAAFFLDSVDEAKFHRSTDFHLAIKRFVSSLGMSLSRATIFLSCRISEWQPATDAEELFEVLQVLNTKENKSSFLSNLVSKLAAVRLSSISTAPHIRTETDTNSRTTIVTVQLEPLSREQVSKFVEVLGLETYNEFLSAIDQHCAWEFARRPIDVIELVNFWTEHRRLGTLSEMLDYAIETSLRPPQRDTHSVLSPQAARDGSMTLGAATSLCREFTFKVPDASFVSPAGLDARQCLPSTWEQEQVRELLSRPLFDSATYGRIRFHHRRVAEFLAAKWISQRVAQGYSTPELRGLLFADTVNGLIARPAMAPVTAWLCCGTESWNGDVRQWTATAAPEIHLLFGDPSCLPLDYRKSVIPGMAFIVFRCARSSRA